MVSADDDLNPIVDQVWDHYGTWNNNTVGKCNHQLFGQSDDVEKYGDLGGLFTLHGGGRLPKKVRKRGY